MGNKFVEAMSTVSTTSWEVTNDILLMNFRIVNACLVGNPDNSNDGWVLVDTGLENSADFILASAKERFGEDSKPDAIILTHGHFDHVGSVKKLCKFWDVPVYIHKLEMPYVTGEKDYPVGDPTVDEGMVAKMSPTFPHTSIDMSFHVAPLPEDGSVPGMVGWQWIHTPGHAEGHISLFREKDGILIAGDAFSTTKQESLSSVMKQKEEISGPPKYLTTDWEAAEKSVRVLVDLNPSIVITSHGKPMEGEEIDKHLKILAMHFQEIAVPNQGRFVDNK